MSIGALTATDLSTLSTDTLKSTNKFIRYDVKGLKASTSYLFFVDGIDYTWNAKQFGKDLGAGLISNASGLLQFGFHYELKYDGQYTFDGITTNTAATKNGGGGQVAINNYTTTNKLLELRGGGSISKFYMPVRILVVPAHTNRSEQHSH